jgi:hypothetical protein
MKTYPMLMILAIIATVALGSLVVVSGTILSDPENIEEIAVEDEIKRTIYITIEDSVGSSDDLR